MTAEGARDEDSNSASFPRCLPDTEAVRRAEAERTKAYDRHVDELKSRWREPQEDIWARACKGDVGPLREDIRDRPALERAEQIALADVLAALAEPKPRKN